MLSDLRVLLFLSLSGLVPSAQKKVGKSQLFYRSEKNSKFLIWPGKFPMLLFLVKQTELWVHWFPIPCDNNQIGSSRFL